MVKASEKFVLNNNIQKIKAPNLESLRAFRPSQNETFFLSFIKKTLTLWFKFEVKTSHYRSRLHFQLLKSKLF